MKRTHTKIFSCSIPAPSWSAPAWWRCAGACGRCRRCWRPCRWRPRRAPPASQPCSGCPRRRGRCSRSSPPTSTPSWLGSDCLDTRWALEWNTGIICITGDICIRRIFKHKDIMDGFYFSFKGPLWYWHQTDFCIKFDGTKVRQISAFNCSISLVIF